MMQNILILKTGDNYDVVAEDCIFFVDNYVIKVPKGRETDYASVPSFFRMMTSRYANIYDKLAIIHDELFCMHRKAKIQRFENHFKYPRYTEHLVTKKLANRIYYHALLQGGCSKFVSGLIYLGLRCFGHIAWNRNKKARELIGSSFRMSTLL
jgi:hypothetical protein